MTPTVAQPALLADWRDLVALTKPRVMSLVVFTGLCGLLAAPQTIPLALGFTAILCIALGCRRRRSAQPMVRARPRREDAPDREPAASGAAHGPPDGPALRRRPVRLFRRADGPRDQSSRRRAAGRLDPVLRADLHGLAEAPDRAEHRDRRRRGGLPAADRMGRGDGQHRASSRPAVRDHLPVDAAAFLGAVAVRPLRLCGRQRADAAGRRRHPEHADADPDLQHRPGHRGDRAVRAWG